jgi:acyl dehydratase
MTLDPRRLLDWSFEPVRRSYAERDSMLYALGLGLSRDPFDRRELAFTGVSPLKALPTMAAVIAPARPWLREVGIDVKAGLHASEAMHFDRPLPPAGTVRASFAIERLVDKGPGKGAFFTLAQQIVDDASGDRLCRLATTVFVRGGGGFGGSPDGLPDASPVPDRPPDLVEDYPIDPRTALIYRLTGDDNPLHADPDLARAAGFDRPIVHGYCTFGIAGWLLVKTLCDCDPSRLAAIEARFSAPIHPGETLRFRLWRDGTVVRFEGQCLEREVVVLGYGKAQLRV